MKIIALAVVALAAFSTQAFAVEDQGRTISGLGVQGTGYVQVKEGFSQPCQFGTVYLPDLSQYNARAMMAVLVAAQSRGAIVSIAYDVNGSGICTANKISAQ
ncbi:MAG TPA: hypothetical protein VGN46_17270 [Luteibacter sp.]|jgi:hypothetical protein|uniref:hypothetical protein n=1 Tax=Luteibacter sp. TaxID=1886636 RepID=UPI002F4084FB